MRTNHKGNSKILRDMNTKMVLNVIRERTSISRVAISRLTHLSRSSVTEIVKDLEKQRWITEEGLTQTNNVGRKPILLKFNHEARFIVGVDLDSDLIIVALTDIGGRIKKKISIATPSLANPDMICENLANIIQSALDEFHLTKKDLSGIGISIPGEISYSDGRVIFAARFGWRNVPLKKMMEEKTGIATYVEQISRTKALGEHWFGIGKGIDNLVYINIGSGVSACVMMDGIPYRGMHNSAGEIGHTPIVRDGPKCSCGNRGCLELFVSSSAIVKRARGGIESGIKTAIFDFVDGNLDNLKVEHVFKAAESRDVFANQIVGEIGYYLGTVIAGIMNCLDPGIIILDGSVINKSDKILLIEVIRDIAMQEIFDFASRKVKIEKGILGENAGIIGAVTLVCQSLFNSMQISKL